MAHNIIVYLLKLMSLGFYKKSTEDLLVPNPVLRPGYNVIKIFSEVQKFVRQKKIHLIRRVKAFILAYLSDEFRHEKVSKSRKQRL